MCRKIIIYKIHVLSLLLLDIYMNAFNIYLGGYCANINVTLFCLVVKLNFD